MMAAGSVFQVKKKKKMGSEVMMKNSDCKNYFHVWESTQVGFKS